MAPAAAAAA